MLKHSYKKCENTEQNVVLNCGVQTIKLLFMISVFTILWADLKRDVLEPWSSQTLYKAHEPTHLPLPSPSLTNVPSAVRLSHIPAQTNLLGNSENTKDIIQTVH